MQDTEADREVPPATSHSAVRQGGRSTVNEASEGERSHDLTVLARPPFRDQGAVQKFYILLGASLQRSHAAKPVSIKIDVVR